MNLETIYVIHHSHTDFGYTHDQPIVWELHRRFIDDAIELAEASVDSPERDGFRWTVETTAPLQFWLLRASPRQIDRFIALEHAGRIEVTGMFANLTPLFDIDQLVETLQFVCTLREDYGLAVRYAMNCDVNGQNWPLVDVLIDAGIEAFSMAVNPYYGASPMPRPNGFWWEGPSGRKLLTWNGWSYGIGWHFGIGRSAQEFEQTWLPRINKRLQAINYPLPAVLIQTFHPVGDNGTAYAGFAEFIDHWNAEGKMPRLQMATPRMWWDAVHSSGVELPCYRGDWTDYWNFGCISSAREQAMNRMSRARLRVADALSGSVLALSDQPQENPLSHVYHHYRPQAWHALHLWDEHTWGADYSVSAPDSEDTASQWHHKANYAYMARSLSHLLLRDALAELARGVESQSLTDLLVFNPLPWDRVIAGEVPEMFVTKRVMPEDATGSRHLLDRMADRHTLLDAAQSAEGLVPEGRFVIKPTRVPGLGYTVVSRESLGNLRCDTQMREGIAIEDNRYRIELDREAGGIVSWYDKRLNCEWVDRDAPYGFNVLVHEKVADQRHPEPRRLLVDPGRFDTDTDDLEAPTGWLSGWRATRRQPECVITHRVYHTPLGQYAIQVLEMPDARGTLRQSVFLPSYADHIECETWLDMDRGTHPESFYLVYPFNLPEAIVKIDLGAQPYSPGIDQLPGVCRDYFTAQGWIDFSNTERGMIIALPENPMLQLGDFHFGERQQQFTLSRPMLLGWIAGNYWSTNFRAHQPGVVHAYYRMQPHAGRFDASMAYKTGLEAFHSRPLLQQMGEPRAPGPKSAQTTSLLRISDSSDLVHVLHIKPGSRDGGIVVRLYNSSDQPQRIDISSGLLKITAAHECDLFEKPLRVVQVTDGCAMLETQPRRVVVVRLEIGT